MGLSSRELKQVKMALSSVPDFTKPKQSLEQYVTSVDMAIDIMNFIEDEIGLSEKKVLDLGCGTGMLAMAASAFGAESVLGVDIDPDVLEVARENVDEDEEDVEFEEHNVLTMDLDEKAFDVVITNPPFGTKDNAHIDSGFILTALRHLAPSGRVYSLHKSSCTDGIIKKFTKKFPIIKATPAATLNWQLKNTYKHHKQKTVDIQVTLVEWFIEENAKSDEREALVNFAKGFAAHMGEADPLV
uniref:Methyltransferase-like protein 5 n=1 Tax=Panagrellus redivivus TaxID=6233 RepID=A0A7E4VQG9_PANRE